MQGGLGYRNISGGSSKAAPLTDAAKTADRCAQPGHCCCPPYSSPTNASMSLILPAVSTFQLPSLTQKSTSLRGRGTPLSSPICTRKESTRQHGGTPPLLSPEPEVTQQKQAMVYAISSLRNKKQCRGNQNGGLANGGLARKAPIGPKKDVPFGAISVGCGGNGADRLRKGPKGPKGPNKPGKGPQKAPICPEKARLPRKDSPPDFLRKFGHKPPLMGDCTAGGPGRQGRQTRDARDAGDCPAALHGAILRL